MRIDSWIDTVTPPDRTRRPIAGRSTKLGDGTRLNDDARERRRDLQQRRARPADAAARKGAGPVALATHAAQRVGRFDGRGRARPQLEGRPLAPGGDVDIRPGALPI